MFFFLQHYLLISVFEMLFVADAAESVLVFLAASLECTLSFFVRFRFKALLPFSPPDLSRHQMSVIDDG